MYVLIDSNHRISKSEKLTDAIMASAQRGELTVIDITHIKALNSFDEKEAFGTWSEVAEYSGCPHGVMDWDCKECYEASK